MADTAGFTKGAVYSNFTRKSDLFRALLEREAGRAAAARRQAIEVSPLGLLPEIAGELARQPGELYQERNRLIAAAAVLVVALWKRGKR